jgi:hypothetical protein
MSGFRHADAALVVPCWMLLSNLPRQMVSGLCRAQRLQKTPRVWLFRLGAGSGLSGGVSEMGKLAGVWRDTILTERRSTKVGID